MSFKLFISLTIIFFLSIFFIPSWAAAAPILAIENVSDSPDPFSPNRDGFEDKTVISATINVSGFKTYLQLKLIWKVSIINFQGKLVKRFYRRAKVKNNSQITVSQIWDGRDRRKKIVTNGKYTYKIDARVQRVRAMPGFGDVTVTGVSPPPIPRLIIKEVSDSPDPFSPDGDGFEDTTMISATISAAGITHFSPRLKRSRLRRLFLTWRLTIKNSQGKLIKRFIRREIIRDNSEINISQTWDGKDYKGKVVPDDKYTYKINARIRRIKAKSGFGDVTVKTKPILSVSLFPDFWKIGSLDPNAIITMKEAEKIRVTNDGTDNTTYSLNLSNPEGWTASQTETAIDTYILNVAFSDELANITWNEADHALSTEPVRSTSTKFAGDQTGVDVACGEKRMLWLQFKAPTATTITSKQEIEVTITAELPLVR